MKKTCLRLLAVIQTLVLTLGLVGCGRPQQPAVSYAELMHMMNQTVSSELGQAVGNPGSWTAHNNTLWVVGHQPGQVVDPAQRQLWVASADTDGANVTAMQLTGDFDPALVEMHRTLAAENPANTYTMNRALLNILFDSADRPHFVLYEVLLQQTPETDLAETVKLQFSLCSAGADGALQRAAVLQFPEELDITSLFPNWCRLTDDRTLWLYLAGMTDGETAGCLLRFDAADGSCTARFDMTGLSAPRSMPDGSLLLLGPGSEGVSFYTLTDLAAETPAFAEAAPCAAGEVRGFAQPLDGVPTEDILLTSDAGILQYDMAAGTARQLLKWEDYGILSTDVTRALYYYPQGATTQFLRVDGEGGISRLSVVDQAALAALPTITVWLFGMLDAAPLKAAIHAYNAQGHDYYIKAEDHTSYFDVQKGDFFRPDFQALSQKLIAREGPDILISDTSILDYASLYRKNYFIDLYPYLDADPQLSRQDLLPNVLQASEVNGALPTVVAGYSVYTAFGDSDVVGDDMGWTWDEFETMVAAYPEARVFYDQVRGGVLQELIFAAGPRFIDRQNGTVHLDSPEFIRLLEMTAGYPTTDQSSEIYAQGMAFEVDWNDPQSVQKHNAIYAQLDPKELFAQRQALLKMESITNFRRILTHEYEFDGPVTYKGLPTPQGTAGAVISPRLRIGISSTCAVPDAAWNFARTLLLPAYQDTLYGMQNGFFPLRKDSLQAAAATARQPLPDDVVSLISIRPNYLPVNMSEQQRAYFSQGLTQAQTEQMLDMICSASVLDNYDRALQDIISEEADYFYNGVRTAAETVAIMQNRARTYLEEQG